MPHQEHALRRDSHHFGNAPGPEFQVLGTGELILERIRGSIPCGDGGVQQSVVSRDRLSITAKRQVSFHARYWALSDVNVIVWPDTVHTNSLSCFGDKLAVRRTWFPLPGIARTRERQDKLAKDKE